MDGTIKVRGGRRGWGTSSALEVLGWGAGAGVRLHPSAPARLVSPPYPSPPPVPLPQRVGVPEGGGGGGDEGLWSLQSRFWPPAMGTSPARW